MNSFGSVHRFADKVSQGDIPSQEFVDAAHGMPDHHRYVVLHSQRFRALQVAVRKTLMVLSSPK